MEMTQSKNAGQSWKGWLWRKGESFWNWLLHGVNWAVVGAAMVEIPRYTAAFLAIHEPWYIGVPLAALLAWSTKTGWEFVFERGWRKAWFVGLLDVIALAVAVTIITPVIYLMMSVPIEEIDMTQFNLWTADPVGLAWSFAMSLITFIPIMLVSSVKAGKRREDKEVEAKAAQVQPAKQEPVKDRKEKPADKPADKPKNEEWFYLSDAMAIKVETNAETVDGEVVKQSAQKNGATEPLSQEKLDAWQMAKNGWTQEQIARKVGRSDRTIRKWIKEVEDEKGA